VNKTRPFHVKKFYRKGAPASLARRVSEENAGTTSRRSSGYHPRAMRPALPALLLGATCIALSPIFVRLSEAGPIATAFWRTALALPALWLLYLAQPRAAPRSSLPRVLLVAAGLAFAGDLAFWHAAIGLTSVANSTLLANLASIFVTLAAWAFLRQRPTALFLAGLAAALGGVLLLVQSSLRFSAHGLLGDALGVVTALFYAGYLLAVKELRDRGCGTLLIMAVTSTITTLALLPIALLSGERIVPVSSGGWLDLVGLALISHAAGQGLIAYALAHLPAAFSSVSLLLQPVMAALFAWLLLAEPLSPLQFAGGAVVLAGIYLARRGSR
jgi:drug/metabolite transporter (DMT)-like permease